MRKGNWVAKPPTPPTKWLLCKERESGSIVVVQRIEPSFSQNSGYRKGSLQAYKYGHWSYFSDYYWRNKQSWECSPFHTDFKEVVAETEEEAINEYINQTRHN